MFFFMNIEYPTPNFQFPSVPIIIAYSLLDIQYSERSCRENLEDGIIFRCFICSAKTYNEGLPFNR
jgi:hypothetical protein